MNKLAGNWDDLGPRLATAVGLILVGAAALIAGGHVLLLVVAAAAGIMIWELVRLLAPGRHQAGIILGVLAAVILLGPLAGIPIWASALGYLVVGAILLRNEAVIFSLYSVLVIAGCFSVFFTRGFYPDYVLWLVLVVVVTDVAGYFVGRILGGPKFWPRISPKKTWSGTIGGWVAAAVVGLLFVPFVGSWAILASVVISFASQMGDIAESAIKRRGGQKDSSTILPGHGGLLDRFDGMVAAFSVWLLMAIVMMRAAGHL